MSKEREGGDWTLLRGNLVTIQFSRHRYELNTASAVSTNAIDFDTMIQCYHFFLDYVDGKHQRCQSKFTQYIECMSLYNNLQSGEKRQSSGYRSTRKADSR